MSIADNGAESLRNLVERIRRLGMEPEEVEVKAAVGGLPKSVPETLSAFANGSGGTLLLGLSEDDDFTPAAGFKAAPIRESLAQACAEKVSPPIRSAIDIVEFEGAHLVRLDVDEIDPLEKPCFVVDRGEYNGSFVRGGDGDRRLSRYEVTQLLLGRSQPTFDLEVVPGATMEDLDDDLVRATIGHAAERAQRTFGSVDTVTALRRLGAIASDGDTIRPTLGGLLCLGEYPQQFFPQLFISFVALPGMRMGETGPGGERFLDNVTVDGPIPEMLSEVSHALRRNMNRAAVIRGLGREDRYDYPLEVIRELVVNALMHRDYSPESRGTQIQLELYPDRLVVRSPGGLHGDVTRDLLGTDAITSTSRNASLAKLLADVPTVEDPRETVVENRGSGLVRVVEALRRAGMSPPEFDVGPGRMTVTVPRNALLSPETIEWISSLGLGRLDNEYHLALAMMRNAGRASTAMLRVWGVESAVAGRVLRDLVDRGLAVRVGGRRYATYQLAADTPTLLEILGPSSTAANRSPSSGIEADLAAIEQAIRAGYVTARAISQHLDIGYQTVLRRLKVLHERGVVERTSPARSSKQSYRLTSS
jgi:ATP-dependent DNA helicase RecG